MGKIISTLALIIMIVLFPPAALITISQGAVQGDATYPIKRWLEGQVLFLASFNPTTRALYAVAQANRRYEESAKLLSMGDNADSTLEELVTQSNIAAGDINQVSSSSEKVKLITDLSDSISKYDQGLEQAQQQITRTSGVGSSQPVQIQTPQPAATTLPSPSQPNPSVGGGLTPVPSSTNQPTPQPSKTSQPTPKPTVSPADEEARRQQEAIEKARRELEELRKKLEEEKKKLQKNAKHNADSAKSPSPTPKPSPSPSPSPSPRPSPSPSPSARANSAAALQPSPSVVATNNPKDKANFNPKWNKTDDDPTNDSDNGDDD